MNKDKVIGILSIIVILILVIVVKIPAIEINVELDVPNINTDFTGGGITHLGELELEEGLVVGGEITAISSAANHTLTAAQICESSVIQVTPINSITTTLPATTTLITDCLSKNGDSMQVMIENAATTTNNITITAPGGGGIDLQEPDGQNVVIGQNNYAYLTFHRISSSNIVVRVDETIPAD